MIDSSEENEITTNTIYYKNLTYNKINYIEEIFDDKIKMICFN